MKSPPRGGRNSPTTARASRAVLSDLRELALRFADADIDGDRTLSFDQFLALQPEGLRKKHDEAIFRKWFDSADLDGSGEISITQYFLLALESAGIKHGYEAMRSAFNKYDPDGSGLLDAFEFQRACNDLGFGLAAAEIFAELDPDISGTVSYHEIMLALRQDGAPLSKAEEKQIHALIKAMEDGYREQTKKVVAMKGLVVGGDTVFEVRAQMRRVLLESGANVVDLVKKFDTDAGTEVLVDEMEFYNALRKQFGFKGSIDLSDEVFASIDTDTNGHITFDELYEFIKGKRHSLDRRNKRIAGLSLEPPSSASYTLEDIAWDADVLRNMMLRTMRRCYVGTTDLIRAWDRNGNGELEEKEFLTSTGRLFRGHEPLWKHVVEPLVRQLFATIVRGVPGSKVFEPTLSVTELEVWLRAAPADAHQRPVPLLPEPFTPPPEAKAQAPAPAATKKKPRPPASPRAGHSARPRTSPVQMSDPIPVCARSPIFRALLLQQATPESLRNASAVRAATPQASPRRGPADGRRYERLRNSHTSFWNSPRMTESIRLSASMWPHRLPPLVSDGHHVHDAYFRYGK